MNLDYFAFERAYYGTARTAQDADLTNQAVENARAATPPAPHRQKSSAEVIAEYSDKDKILSAEEMIEHRKHCRAKPGNCPFEKAKDEADDISPKDIHITKQTVFNRFAALLTQMFTMAKNLAKPAIAEPTKVEANAEGAVAQDESPANEPNPDAKLVAELIESGIEKMVELAKSNGCFVDMNESKSKYIVRGPSEKPENA